MANESASKPMYEQIFEALRERIKEGQYAVGDRVPSEKELGDEFATCLDRTDGTSQIGTQPGQAAHRTRDDGFRRCLWLGARLRHGTGIARAWFVSYSSQVVLHSGE